MSLATRLTRSAVSLGVALGVTVVALALALVVVAAGGNSVSDTISAYYNGAFGDSDAINATISVMIPLILVALGWIVASSARQINLGLEGQILAGGTCATVVGVNFHDMPQALHLPLAVLAGALGGALWAAIPAVLYLTRNVSVLLSSFLLNFVAGLLVAYLVRGPLKDPAGLGLIASKPVALDSQWPKVGETMLTWDWVLVPIFVIGLLIVQRRTTVGFRLRLISANEEAARNAGVRTRSLGARSLLVSGAFAGIAGSSLILDSFSGTMVDNFSANYGFIGIAVALLARGNPVGCIASALLFAALEQGGGLAQSRVGVPSAAIDVTNGLVIIFIAASAFLLYRIVARRAAAEGKVADVAV